MSRGTGTCGKRWINGLETVRCKRKVKWPVCAYPRYVQILFLFFCFYPCVVIIWTLDLDYFRDGGSLAIGWKSWEFMRYRGDHEAMHLGGHLANLALLKCRPLFSSLQRLLNPINRVTQASGHFLLEKSFGYLEKKPRKIPKISLTTPEPKKWAKWEHKRKSGARSAPNIQSNLRKICRCTT